MGSEQDTDKDQEGHQTADVESLVVDGQEVRVTKEQLRADAQKARAVLPKLQSEHDRLKEELEDLKGKADPAFSFIMDLEKTLQGDKAAKDKLLKTLGMSVEELGAALGVAIPAKKASSTASDDEDDELLPDPTGGPKKRGQWSMDDLDPELRKDLAFARKRRLADLRESLHGELGVVLQANDKIAKIVGEDAKRAAVVNGLARKALQRRVNLEDAEAGPRLYHEIATEVAQTLEDLGIRPAGKDESPKELSAYGLGEVGTEFSSEELHQEQPPKRVSVTSGDYSRNFAQRLLHRIVKAGGLAPAE